MVATVAFAALAGAPGNALPRAWSTGDAPLQDAAVQREPGHTSWIRTFVDPSRPTVPITGPALPSRTLATTIYRPNGRGQFPLIVFAHGFIGHPEKFTKLFAAWADAGFVVVAPAFPLTNNHAPSLRAADVAHQPADMSFVLDQVLALDKQRGSGLFRSIDQQRIGAGGLSLGGLTVSLLTYSACCRDRRIDAVAVLNGARSDAPPDGHVPLLIAHSDSDPLIPYSSAREAFDVARPPAWLMTFHGASHASQWEDDVTLYDQIAEQTTTDFWQATINRNRRQQALTRLEQDATVPFVSSIEAKR